MKLYPCAECPKPIKSLSGLTRHINTMHLRVPAQDSKFNRFAFGGNREAAILRDGEKCVNCGMTRKQHREKYGRDITVDHIDGKGRNTVKLEKNNSLDNLQTLCMRCHGAKDGRRRVKKGQTT